MLIYHRDLFIIKLIFVFYLYSPFLFFLESRFHYFYLNNLFFKKNIWAKTSTQNFIDIMNLMIPIQPIARNNNII